MRLITRKTLDARRNCEFHGTGFKVRGFPQNMNFPKIVMIVDHKPCTVSREPFCYLYAADDAFLAIREPGMS